MAAIWLKKGKLGRAVYHCVASPHLLTTVKNIWDMRPAAGILREQCYPNPV